MQALKSKSIRYAADGWRGGWRIVLLLPALALAPWAAFAGCNDAPAPGVDWTSCEKHRLILRKIDPVAPQYCSPNS